MVIGLVVEVTQVPQGRLELANVLAVLHAGLEAAPGGQGATHEVCGLGARAVEDVAWVRTVPEAGTWMRTPSKPDLNLRESE